MNRGILIKLIVILLVAGLVHSVFWFYKAGQLEKHVNNYIAENNSSVLAGQVKVTGSPFSQKITITDLKFSLPNPAFSKYQIVVKELEANSGIFDNNYVIDINGPVSLQDHEGNLSTVEFNQKPQISFVIADGMIAKISYSDSGYRVLDNNKNAIYSAASTMINVESKIDENEQIISNLKVNVREMDGFDIIDAYRSSSEKRIIDGIKTGEITIGNNAQAGAMIKSEANAIAVNATNLETKMANATNSQAIAASTNQAVASVVANVNAAVASVAAKDADLGAAAKIPPVAPAPVPTAQTVPAPAPVAPAVANAPAAVAPVVAVPTANAAPALADQTPTIVVSNIPDKNNLVIDVDYILTPNRNDQKSTTPFDPSQIHDLNVQYNSSIKINNLELSNSLYKIVITGQVNGFLDDNMPSGNVSIKVDNMMNLVNHIVTRFNEMSKKDEVVEQAQGTADVSATSQVNVSQDAYQGFLKKVASGLPDITKELAAKNQMTKDNVAVFDLRRDKNLEFIVNDTPLREVIGKF